MDRQGAISPSAKRGVPERDVVRRTSVASTNFSIQSSMTPYYKNGHSMTKQPNANYKAAIYDADLENPQLKRTITVEPVKERVKYQPKIEVKPRPRFADASTQVFTRTQNI